MIMSNDKPFSYEEYKDIYSKVPRLCVDLVIKTPEGIILSLRKLKSWYGKWHFPGGAVFYKEKVIDAVKRVALTEVGIDVNIEEFLGYIDEYSSEEKEVGFGSTVSLVFLCSAEAVSMKPGEDSLEIKIFKSLPDNMIEEHRHFLDSKREYIMRG